jgi:hypothetical protein
MSIAVLAQENCGVGDASPAPRGSREGLDRTVGVEAVQGSFDCVGIVLQTIPT